LSGRGFWCRRVYPPSMTPSLPPTLSDGIIGTCGVIFQALAISGSTASLIEGNRVSHCQSAGRYNDTAATGSVVVRYNHFRWVRRGPNYNMGQTSNPSNSLAPQVPASSLIAEANAAFATFIVAPLAADSGTTPTMVAVPHGLVVGQPVQIRNAKVGTNPSPILNIVSKVLSVDLSANSFTYGLDVVSGVKLEAETTAPPPEVISVNFTRELVFENNTIEIIPTGNSISQLSIAIRLFATAVDPFTPDPYVKDSFRAFGNALIQSNLVRYIASPDGIPLIGDSANDLAIEVSYLIQGRLENNVIDLANSTPMHNYRSSFVRYFNNRKSSGQLIQGSLQDPVINQYYPVQELTTLIDDATALALL
jgi:hypothetical protein